MPVRHTNTLIIGASISGLACAATLQKQGLEYLLVEKYQQVATPWRNHYERLHLHTNKRLSALPYKKFGSALPRYPSRQQVIDYLDDYQKTFAIKPIFNTEAISVKKMDGYWITETNHETFRSKYLVMATGAYGKPKPIEFNGMDTFTGEILHSSEYKTGSRFEGKRVLVIGFGNSACEIAIDLYEQGAIPFMSVRSPVNVIPRDVLGIPVLELGLLLSRLNPRIADTVSAPLMRWLTGDLTTLGLEKMHCGPLEQISRYGTVPALDIGAIQHIRKGHIQVMDGIDHIDGAVIYFKNGKKERFDAIVAAIGYCRDDAKILKVDKSRFDDLQLSTAKQKFFGKDGLYFCGYWIGPTGQIREIALDAKRIAKDIAASEGV